MVLIFCHVHREKSKIFKLFFFFVSFYADSSQKFSCPFSLPIFFSKEKKHDDENWLNPNKNMF